jgi:hypothetical protein
VTATAFERLLYTDCRAGQGRGGGPGFQIQAQSARVTANLARLAVDTLLYVAPTEWLTSRAVEDFPLGLSHAAGEGWGTAQSRYLGKEATGSRSGNHLADCLLTLDRGPYGAIRPAQLLGAEVWRDVPFETTECPPFDDFLEPGPLTNDSIQAWLREDARRAETLGRLLTVLEDPRGPQVLIVADDTEDAVRWIAAATILLPIEDALDVTFKVFVTDFDRSPQRVLGALKALHPSITPETAGGKFVVDATTDVGGDGPTSERAAYWVGHLAEAEDPYDVVAAVDFARALAAGDSAEARETAWLITAESEPITEAEPVIAWLRRPKNPELGEHESAVANRLIDSGLVDFATLVWMEQMADADRLYVDRPALRRGLLTMEIEEVETTPPRRVREMTPVDIGDGPRRDAESAISSALLLTTDGIVVDRLLRIARDHQVTLALPPLRERLAAFVADWIAEPTRRYDPGKWALAEFILGELARQLTDGDPSESGRAPNLARARPLIEQVWTYLVRLTDDPRQPLTWELLAASVATSPAGTKRDDLRRAFRKLEDADGGERALTGFQEALVAWRALADVDAVDFVALAPDGLQPRREIVDKAVVEIRRKASQPDAHLLDAIWLLEDRRLLPRTSTLEDLSRSDRTIWEFRQAVADGRSMEELSRLPSLGAINVQVLRVRGAGLVDACLADDAPPLLGAHVIGSLSQGRVPYFLEPWSRRLDRERGVTAAARGFRWSEDPATHLPTVSRREIANRLIKYAASLDEAEKVVWIREVEAQLGPEASGFEPFVTALKRHPRLNLGRPKRD